MSVTVLAAGLSTSLQDAGRPGQAALGLGRSGAIDSPAWQLANALAGNRHGEAALECTLTGPTLRFERPAIVALTGAFIDARVGSSVLPMWTSCSLPAGSILRLGGMRAGCRSYLAVGGGFTVPRVLGSRSSDLHAGIGGMLQAGDVLPLGEFPALSTLPVRSSVHVPGWSLDPRPWFDVAQRPLEFLRGSHASALDEPSHEWLHGGWPFTLSQASNRTASRLDGHLLQLERPLELISEAALPGTMQLPPSGQPIVLMAEAPVTGGYPRIGQLAAVDLPRLAQRRPGDAVCFRETSMDRALARLAARRERLARLLDHIAQRLEIP